MRPIAVVGAGWAGASLARTLHDAGVAVEVFESAAVVGGHSRSEVLNGVVYEPNGAHIFHTSDQTVAEFVQRFGLTRNYEHKVVAAVQLEEGGETQILSWPPQVQELKELPLWPQIDRELSSLPPEPTGEDFQSFVVSMMGPTLYRLFIRDYTIKQWDRDPSELSSSFAPKRVELRRDGYRRLFRDRWEFFHPEGSQVVIEEVLRPIRVTCGAPVGVADLDDLAREFSAAVITSPLDSFVGREGALEWRGISMRSSYCPTEQAGTTTAGYVVNHPSMDVAYTRTVETKHASGQLIAGTVVSEEYPGSPARHYPVPTVDRANERRNDALKDEISGMAPLPVAYCGRLANYQYINQDQAIAQGIACASAIASRVS